jgi:hypothetical protein
MVRNFFLVLATVFVAFGILFTSIARTASVRYVFKSPSQETDSRVLGDSITIDYVLPYPGKVMPDSNLWFLKAVRDRLWLLVTPSAERKAELNLLFADKRLVMAKMLFEKDKPEIAFSTLSKAEKYLESAVTEEEAARASGVKTDELLDSLALSSLKHVEEMEEMQKMAPEDAAPQIITLKEKYAEKIFNQLRDVFYEEGLVPPDNPFNGQ